MIVTIIGARPQFVKAAVISKELSSLGIEERIIHTGQHYDEKLSKIIWEELGLPPYDKNLEVGSGQQGYQTGKMIELIEAYLLPIKNKVAAVLVYGDTNSTMAGAIAASKLNIKVIHVEAGLRSFNRNMPEEINRIVTDHISELLFCPSNVALKQLKNEGINKNVYNVGDVMYDALLLFSKIAKNKNDINEILPFKNQPYTILTIHRQSNTDDYKNIQNILDGLEEISIPCFWPVHPRNNKILNLLNIPSNVYTNAPSSYLEMLILLENCTKVITDSGGLQKEAYWMKKPCITLRDETEWIETLHNNWNILVSNDKERLIDAFNNDPLPQSWKKLYGNGVSGKKIAKKIQKFITNDNN